MDGWLVAHTRLLLALLQLDSQAPISRCHPQTFGAAGAPPNPDLAALVANPTPGSGLLYPASALCSALHVCLKVQPRGLGHRTPSNCRRLNSHHMLQKSRCAGRCHRTPSGCLWMRSRSCTRGKVRCVHG